MCVDGDDHVLSLSLPESALTGELKICRLSTTVSGVDGGEEVFMFVEKVCKSK